MTATSEAYASSCSHIAVIPVRRPPMGDGRWAMGDGGMLASPRLGAGARSDMRSARSDGTSGDRPVEANRLPDPPAVPMPTPAAPGTTLGCLPAVGERAAPGSSLPSIP
jgi:hypothetical protein